MQQIVILILVNRVHYFLTTGYHSASGTLTHQQLMIDRLQEVTKMKGSTNATTYAVYARAQERVLIHIILTDVKMIRPKVMIMP